MIDKSKYVINKDKLLVAALQMLNEIPDFLTLFVSDENDKIIGTITDGDIRRGIINGLGNNNAISEFMNKSFTFLRKGTYEKEKLDFIKAQKLEIIPILNDDFSLFKVLDFNHIKTILPIDAVIMAGGKGTRLLPLTKDIPKPMLKVGDKPIIEYNIDLLKSFGINHITLSINHLGNLIMDYFKDGSNFDVNINYVTEDEPLGTIGAVKQIKHFFNDYILVMNSDLLTNIDLESMFFDLINQDAEMTIATTDYEVQIPYGVIEADGMQITALKEKPTYTYYSNAGIYIFKKSCLEFIPSHSYFNATDLLEKLLENKRKVIHYPIKNYWLDIGKHIDYEKAQFDVKQIKF